MSGLSHDVFKGAAGNKMWRFLKIGSSAVDVQ